MEKHDFTVKQELAGERLDKFLAEALNSLSRSAAVNMIESGNVTVNGAAVKKKHILSEGDEIVAECPEPQEYMAEPEDIPLDVVFEDSEVIVINKPRGMVVHPAAGNYTGTLVNALLHHCGDSLSGINGIMRPGIVHRIDKNTSGLIIAAKNDAAHSFLSNQLQDHSLYREYIAIVKGSPKQDSGTINAPIGRSEKDRKKMAVTPKNSKEAITHYEVLERLVGYSVVKCRLQTGRTHQIRVHMAYNGHPVAGDDVYSKPQTPAEKALMGQCLHAKKLSFIHPKSQTKIELETELPDYFQTFLNKYR